MARFLGRRRAGRGRIAELEAELERLNGELRRLRTDPITDLPTRAYWTRLATEAYPHGRAVVLADLDGFKAVNDIHGHAVGDLVLARAADRLRTSLPTPAIVGRLGGDEFAAITTCPITGKELDDAAEVITAPTIRTPDGAMLRIGISVGVVDLDRLDQDSLPTALGAADLAMYAAKRDGGGWCPYERSIHGAPTIIPRPRQHAA